MNASNEDDILVNSEELLARIPNWTLACDNLLLNKLKQFSRDLEQQSSSLSQECRELSNDVAVVDAKLGNVTNQFLSLSSRQFVENRVQEFEERVVPVPVKEKKAKAASNNAPTKAEREAELLSKMKQAIQIGISVTAQHVQNRNQELSSLSSSSSSSSQTQTNSKLHLPYLIGSTKYFSNRFVGMVEDEVRPRRDFGGTSHSHVPPEVSTTTYGDEGLSSQHQAGSTEPVHAHVPTNYIPNIEPVPSLMSSTAGQNSKYFGDNQTQNHIPSQPSQSTPSMMIPPQFIDVPNEVKPQPNRTTQAAAKNRHTNNLFHDDGPPPIEDSDNESDNDFGPPTRVSTGRGGGRLFADDDDEDDIFNESHSWQPPPKHSQNPFFHNNPFSIPPPITNSNARMSPPPLPEESSSSGTRHTNKGSLTNGIKENANTSIGKVPETNEQFANNVANRNAKQETKQDEPSAKNEKSHSHEVGPKSKVPPGGVSIFGSVPPTEIPKLRTSNSNAQHAPERVHEHDDHSESEPGGSGKCVTVSRESTPRLDTNEDAVSTSHSSLTSKGLNSSQGSIASGSVAASLPPPLSRQKKPRGIFQDDESDEDLFSSNNKSRPSLSKQKQKPNSTAPFINSHAVTVPPPRSSSESIKSNSAQGRIKKSIFDDSDSEDDLFSSASSSSSRGNQFKPSSSKPLVFPTLNEEKGKPKQPGGLLSRIGLFADSSEDESDPDLFGGLSSHKNKKQITSDKEKKKEVTAQVDKKNKPLPNSKDRRIMETEKEELIQKEKENEQSVSATSSVKTESKLKEEITETKAEAETTPILTKSESVEKKEEARAVDNKSEGSDDEMTKLKLKGILGSGDEVDKASSVPIDLDKNKSSEVEESKKSEVKGNKNKISVSALKEKLAATKVADSSPNSKGTGDAGGSKIAKLKEKLSSEPDEKPKGDSMVSKLGTSKPKVNVKKLALGLNINPLAMMPGAKPVKQGSLESPSSDAGSPSGAVDENEKQQSPEKESPKLEEKVNVEDTIVPSPGSSSDVTPSTPPTISEINNGNRSRSVSVSPTKTSAASTPSPTKEEPPSTIDAPAPLLTTLSKGRPKAPGRRRPPSKQLLHSYQNRPEPPEPEEEKLNDVVKNNEEEKVNDVKAAIENDRNSEEPPKSQNISENHPVEPSTDPLLFQSPPSPPPSSDHEEEPQKDSGKQSSIWDNWDDDDNENERDIFASKATEQRKKAEKKKDPDLANQVPSDEQKDNAARKHETTTQEQGSILGEESDKDKAPQSDSSNPSQPEPEQMNNNTTLFSDEPPPLFPPSSSKTRGLFAEEDSDDDIFTSASKKDKTDPPPKKPSMEKERVKEKVKHVEKPKAKAKNTKKKGLFDSDSDSDDLFKTAKKDKDEPKKTSKDSTASGSGKQTVVKKSIFDDDSDDDLFATKKK